MPALIALAISVPTALAQTPVVTQPSAQTANNASSTIAVSNTFQSVFAASAKRFGCSIQNNGSNSMWVYFGPIANATKATSFVVTAGSALLCGSLGVVAKDQVSITGTAADAFTATQDGSPSLNGGGSGGGGGGGAVTIADGADVTQGAIADAVVAAGAFCRLTPPSDSCRDLYQAIRRQSENADRRRVWKRHCRDLECAERGRNCGYSSRF